MLFSFLPLVANYHAFSHARISRKRAIFSFSIRDGKNYHVVIFGSTTNYGHSSSLQTARHVIGKMNPILLLSHFPLAFCLQDQQNRRRVLHCHCRLATFLRFRACPHCSVLPLCALSDAFKYGFRCTTACIGVWSGKRGI